MAFVSLYRKYRSQSFDDLVGQDHVVKTLQNGIASSRIAHSYLFTGPRGTGKTSTARLLAKALCCEKGPSAEPCNECDICRAITEGSCMDVLEMDAASDSGVNDIRETIVNVVDYRPSQARYKVYIIDEVHDLSKQAFDALLKTIEEPPSHAIFILATTEYVKVPPTIRSRCQKYEFHRATLQDLIARLRFVAESEGISIDQQALFAIAKMADGGYRDALTLLEQASLTAEGSVTLQTVYDQLGLIAEEQADDLLIAIALNEPKAVLEKVAMLQQQGRDPGAILESLVHRLADLTRIAYNIDTGLETTAEAAAHTVAQKIGMDNLLSIRTGLSRLHSHLRQVSLPKYYLEAELLRLAMSGFEATTSAPAKTKVSAPATKPKKPDPEPAVVEPVKVTVQAVVSVAADPPNDNTSQTPAIDDKWQLCLQKLHKKSPALYARVEASEAIFGDQSLTLRVTSMNREWLENDPRKMSAVSQAVREVYGQEFTVTLERRQVDANGPTSVELEYEGQAAHDLVRQKFKKDKS